MTQQSSSVEFAVRFQTLGTLNAAKKIEAALMQSGAVEGSDQRYAANFAFLLAHTTSIVVRGDHPELLGLAALWAYWQDHNRQPIDGAALWEQRLDLLGLKASEVWNRALLDEQQTSLDAPRELLPDEKLTDGERSDPNS